MNLKPSFKTVEEKISWGNIEDAIAAFLYPIMKGKIGPEDVIKSIKLEYKGGFLPQDKEILATVLVRKGV